MRRYNEALLFGWLWAVGAWDRAKGFALGSRREVGAPGLYPNFEALARAQGVNGQARR